MKWVNILEFWNILRIFWSKKGRQLIQCVLFSILSELISGKREHLKFGLGWTEISLDKVSDECILFHQFLDEGDFQAYME